MPRSFNGEWHIPSSPNQKLKGILEFDSSRDKYSLKLYSSNNLHGTAIDSKPDPVTGYRIILGDCTFGEKVTLVSADIRSRKAVHDQLYILTIEPDWILTGGHFNSVENIKIRQFSCAYKFLTSWIDGDQTYFEDLAPLSGTSALREKIPIKLPGEINVTFLRTLQREGFDTDRKISFEVKYTAVFTSDHYLPFAQFHSRAFELKTLMEFSVGKKVQLDYYDAVAELNATGSESRRDKDNDHLPLRIDFGNQRDVLKTDKALHQNGMLFSRQGIGPVKFLQVVYKWFDSLKTHAVIYDIYVDTNEWFESFGIYLTPVMYNNRILNLVQALEAFHSVEYESEEESEGDFRKGLSDILNLLSNEKDKEWLKDRTAPKRKTLRQRLKRLLNEYAAIMDEMFSDNKSKKTFINDLNALRNKLSHARHQSTDLDVDTEEYYFKAKLLLVACILNKLGFEMELIKDILETSHQYGPRYGFYKRLANKSRA